MRTGGRGNRHDFEPGCAEEFVEVADDYLNAKFFVELLGAFASAARKRTQEPAALHGLNCLGVEIGNVAKPDDPEAASGGHCHSKISSEEFGVCATGLAVLGQTRAARLKARDCR